MEKVAGLKEEIKGKILRKPELVQHGHDRRTGRLAKKAREQVSTNEPHVDCRPILTSPLLQADAQAPNTAGT